MDTNLLDCIIDAMLALTLLFSAPRMIVLNEEGMAQNRWYGPKKFIPWNDIAKIETGRGGGAVTITSRSGIKVIHSSLLADRQRFMQESFTIAKITSRPNFHAGDKSSSP
ncbi:MAG TPA: hypothetical protein VHA37_09800 [Candidatus Saccharimonadales bacterium]|nr:hypothetical protein [Candidatus Saccharimonadales bacterium]